jgi:acetyl esterase
MPLPLRTAVFWNVYKVLERSPAMQQPVDKVRAASDLRKKMLKLPPSRLVTFGTHADAVAEDTSMTLEDGTVLPLRIHRPKSASAGPLPVIVNFHGGGWVSGDVRQSEWWASSVAALAGVVVVSVEYRLAPEFPFPIPVEDCYAATVWTHDHAADLGVDPERLATMGDSAGGNLAAVVPMVARDRGGPPIALQILLYPSVDLDGDFASERENANAPVLGKKDLDNVPGLYFYGTGLDLGEPYASPIRGKHHDLPPALIQTAQYDPLRDHGYAYAAALRAAGVQARHTNYVGAVHGYISLPGVAPAARQALAETVDVVRETLGG